MVATLLLGLKILSKKNIKPQKKNSFSDLYEELDYIFEESQGSVVGLDILLDRMGKRPFGIKKAIRPLLAYLYYLTRKDLVLYNKNYYDEIVFVPEFKDYHIEEVTNCPDKILFKVFDIDSTRQKILELLANAWSAEFGKNAAGNAPLDIARNLVKHVLELPSCTRVTRNISKEAQNLRLTIKRAHDPNKLLFVDLPELFQSNDADMIVKNTIESVKELTAYYSGIIEECKSVFFKNIDNDEEIDSLRMRAKNISESSGDFSMNAFINRIRIMTDFSDESFDGIFSTVISKSPKEWSDSDKLNALNSIVEKCQKFRKIEVYQSLDQQQSNRNAFAFIHFGEGRNAISKTYDVSNRKGKK